MCGREGEGDHGLQADAEEDVDVWLARCHWVQEFSTASCFSSEPLYACTKEQLKLL